MIRGTSHAAKRSIKSASAGQRARVFQFILRSGTRGATDQEVELALGMAGNTVRPRRIELGEKGFVEDSGETRLTSSGRKAIVWKVPEAIVVRARKVIEDRKTPTE